MIAANGVGRESWSARSSAPARCPAVFHHHGFKCAGTTLSWILERNFPGAVLYVEGRRHDERLAWQTALAVARDAGAEAVSSHLATVPPRNHAAALLHVAFVREPRARLVSAHLFQNGDAADVGTERAFERFLEHVRCTIVSNYQTRHLSPQDAGGWTRRAGWELRPDQISLRRPDVVVGVVERMDESLVVLERLLAAKGVAFDAAFPRPQNAGPYDIHATQRLVARVPDDMVELDEVLYARADAALAAACERLGIREDDLAAFRRRCEALTRVPTRVTVPSPDAWTYVPGGPPNGDAVASLPAGGRGGGDGDVAF